MPNYRDTLHPYRPTIIPESIKEKRRIKTTPPKKIKTETPNNPFFDEYKDYPGPTPQSGVDLNKIN